MNKLYIFLILSIFGLYPSVYGQLRYIDFEAECISPKGTHENGDRDLLRFNGINRGPDEIIVNDSSWYVLYDYIDGAMGKIYYQGGLRMNYHLAVGSKFEYKDNYDIVLYFPDLTEPKQVQFCMKFLNYNLTGNRDTIFYSYKDTIASNDSCCQTLTILPMGTSVKGLATTKDEFAHLYPNPSNGRFNLVVDWLLAKEQSMDLVIYDLNGRMVYKSIVNSNGAYSSIVPLDLMDKLRAGIYAVCLQGKYVSSVQRTVIK